MKRLICLFSLTMACGFAQQVSVESVPAWLKTEQLALRQANSAQARQAEQPASTILPGDVVFSQIATGSGWATTIYVTNLSSISQTGYLDFWTPTGELWNFPSRIGRGDRITITLGPGATTVIESDDSVALQQGWASLTTSSPEVVSLAGAAVFRQRVAGRPDFEATVPLTSWIHKDVVLLYDNSGGFVTTAALVNSATSSMTVPCSVRDGAGQTLEAANVIVPAFGQVAFTFPDRFVRSRGIRGSVICRAPSNDLSALTLRFHPMGSFTFFPIMVNLEMSRLGLSAQ